MRNYKNDIISIKWCCYDVTDYYNKIFSKSLLKHPLFRKNIISEIDEFLDKNIIESYHLYAPHFGSPFFQILYTNKLCIDGSYIQEGGVPFKNAYITHISWYKEYFYRFINKYLISKRRFWYPCAWFVDNRLYKQDKIISYAISNLFFRFLPSYNKIICWPKIDLEININNSFPIFIFDGFVGNKLFDSSFYLSICKRLIQTYSARNCYVKFHPAQSKEEKKMILLYFKEQKTTVEELSMSIPFELILSTIEHLKIIGLGSSLLFFARDLGHEVICHDRWLTESPDYCKYKQTYGFKFFDE